VGLPKAKELLYTGRDVLADEAERIGLLNQVVPSVQLRAAALDMAQLIARNDGRMVQGIKRLVHEDVGMPWRERYDNEERARATWLTSAHPRDGFKEFLERRPRST
jgi:enoyl-CoA hydratase/carnithine racemase